MEDDVVLINTDIDEIDLTQKQPTKNRLKKRRRRKETVAEYTPTGVKLLFPDIPKSAVEQRYQYYYDEDFVSKFSDLKLNSNDDCSFSNDGIGIFEADDTDEDSDVELVEDDLEYETDSDEEELKISEEEISDDENIIIIGEDDDDNPELVNVVKFKKEKEKKEVQKTAVKWKLASNISAASKHEYDLFPSMWVFREDIITSLGNHLDYRELERLIDLFITTATPIIEDCKNKPNRSARFKSIIVQYLLFFKYYFETVPEAYIGLMYFHHKMAMIGGMYYDTELRASTRKKETCDKIASRICLLSMFILGSPTNAVEAIFYSNQFVTVHYKLYRDICLPVLRKLLEIDVSLFTECTYVKYILALKLWKKFTRSIEERKYINDKACKVFKVEVEYIHQLSAYQQVLPRVPLSHKDDITRFLLIAKINVSLAIKEFCKILERMRDITFNKECKNISKEFVLPKIVKVTVSPLRLFKDPVEPVFPTISETQTYPFLNRNSEIRSPDHLLPLLQSSLFKEKRNRPCRPPPHGGTVVSQRRFKTFLPPPTEPFIIPSVRLTKRIIKPNNTAASDITVLENDLSNAVLNRLNSPSCIPDDDKPKESSADYSKISEELSRSLNSHLVSKASTSKLPRNALEAFLKILMLPPPPPPSVPEPVQLPLLPPPICKQLSQTVPPPPPLPTLRVKAFAGNHGFNQTHREDVKSVKTPFGNTLLPISLSCSKPAGNTLRVKSFAAGRISLNGSTNSADDELYSSEVAALNRKQLLLQYSDNGSRYQTFNNCVNGSDLDRSTFDLFDYINNAGSRSQTGNNIDLPRTPSSSKSSHERITNEKKDGVIKAGNTSQTGNDIDLSGTPSSSKSSRERLTKEKKDDINKWLNYHGPIDRKSSTRAYVEDSDNFTFVNKKGPNPPSTQKDNGKNVIKIEDDVISIDDEEETENIVKTEVGISSDAQKLPRKVNALNKAGKEGIKTEKNPKLKGEIINLDLDDVDENVDSKNINSPMSTLQTMKLKIERLQSIEDILEKDRMAREILSQYENLLKLCKKTPLNRDKIEKLMSKPKTPVNKSAKPVKLPECDTCVIISDDEDVCIVEEPIANEQMLIKNEIMSNIKKSEPVIIKENITQKTESVIIKDNTTQKTEPVIINDDVEIQKTESVIINDSESKKLAIPVIVPVDSALSDNVLDHKLDESGIDKLSKQFEQVLGCDKELDKFFTNSVQTQTVMQPETAEEIENETIPTAVISIEQNCVPEVCLENDQLKSNNHMMDILPPEFRLPADLPDASNNVATEMHLENEMGIMTDKEDGTDVDMSHSNDVKSSLTLREFYEGSFADAAAVRSDHLNNTIDTCAEYAAQSRRASDTKEMQIPENLEVLKGNHSAESENNYEARLLDNYNAELQDNYGAQLPGNYNAQLQDNYGAQLQNSYIPQLEDNCGAQLQDNYGSELQDDYDTEIQDDGNKKLQDNSVAEHIENDTANDRLYELITPCTVDNTVDDTFENMPPFTFNKPETNRCYTAQGANTYLDNPPDLSHVQFETPANAAHSADGLFNVPLDLYRLHTDTLDVDKDRYNMQIGYNRMCSKSNNLIPVPVMSYNREKRCSCACCYTNDALIRENEKSLREYYRLRMESLGIADTAATSSIGDQLRDIMSQFITPAGKIPQTDPYTEHVEESKVSDVENSTTNPSSPNDSDVTLSTPVFPLPRMVNPNVQYSPSEEQIAPYFSASHLPIKKRKVDFQSINSSEELTSTPVLTKSLDTSNEDECNSVSPPIITCSFPSASDTYDVPKPVATNISTKNNGGPLTVKFKRHENYYTVENSSVMNIQQDESLLDECKHIAKKRKIKKTVKPSRKLDHAPKGARHTK